MKAESRAKRILLIVVLIALVPQIAWFVCATNTNKKSARSCQEMLKHEIDQLRGVDIARSESSTSGTLYGTYFVQQRLAFTRKESSKQFNHLPMLFTDDARNVASGTPNVFIKDDLTTSNGESITLVVVCELIPTDIIDFLRTFP